MSKVAWIIGIAIVLAVVVLGFMIFSGDSSDSSNISGDQQSQTLPAQSDSGTSLASDEVAAESEIDSSFLDEEDDVSFGDVI